MSTQQVRDTLDVQSLLSDGMTVLNEIDHLRSHLRTWMRPTRAAADWLFFPARTEVRYQPLGVVGVIAPWNYPYLTAVNSIIPALMAGNTVVLKHAAATLLVAERFQEAFDRARLPKGVFQHLVQGMQPVHAATFAIMIPLLLAAALAASYVPARRASRVDPVSALRQE